jgi:hypothetical protein
VKRVHSSHSQYSEVEAGEQALKFGLERLRHASLENNRFATPRLLIVVTFTVAAAIDSHRYHSMPLLLFVNATQGYILVNRCSDEDRLADLRSGFIHCVVH